MNLGTAAFFVGTLCVVGFTYWFYDNTDRVEKQELQAAQLLGHVDVQDLHSFKLMRVLDQDGGGKGQASNQGRVLELQKSQGVWGLVWPFEDRAAQMEVDLFLEDFSNLNLRTIEAPHAEADILAFGLKGPGMWRLLLGSKKEGRGKGRGGKFYVFKVGSERAFDGSFHVQKWSANTQSEALSLASGDPKASAVYLADESLVNFLEKQPNDLREKHLFRKEGFGDFRRVEFFNTKRPDLNYTLSLVDGQWKVSGFLEEDELRLDESEVESLIEGLRFLQATSVVESEKTPKLLTEYKLRPAERVVRAYLTKPAAEADTDAAAAKETPPDLWELRLSALKGDVAYAVSNHTKAVYGIKEDFLKTLDKSVSDLLDRAYPFKFDKDEVVKLRYMRAGEDVVELVLREKWVTNNDKVRVPHERVERLLEQMASLRVKEFLSKAQHDFSKVENVVELFGSEYQKLFRLSWTKASTGWVVQTLPGRQYEVEESLIDSIATAELLVPKN